MSDTSIMYDLGLELGEAGSSIAKALADGKVSTMEGIDMAKEIGTLGYCIFKNRSEFGADFKDGLDELEAAELKNGFFTGFDRAESIDEDVVEGVFETAMEVAVAASKFFVKTEEATPAV